MTRLFRSLPWILAAAAAILAGCSQSSSPDPNAKKVISSCLSFSGDDASTILGTSGLTANRMSGDDAPKSTCAYRDANNTTIALITLEDGAKYKDIPATLAADEKSIKTLFSTNIKQPEFHPADGFAAGSFYADITPQYKSYQVELETFVNGYKLLVVINGPSDFATGEKHAAAIANKVADAIKNGTAFTTL